VLVLLDESLPRQLALELSEFDVRTISQHWSGLSNGELLGKAAGLLIFCSKKS
jgi:hypothetical protein